MNLILPGAHGFTQKAIEDLSHDATQLLIDMEVFWVSLGLSVQLRCMPCMRFGAGDPFCEGSTNDDCTEFTVECACTKRIGRGHFTVPPAPPSAIHPREHLDQKRTQWLTRDEMQQIKAFETLVFERLKLQYLLRCLRCQMEHADRDGITGVKSSTASEFIMECACTKRIYKGADAPLLSH